MARVTRSPSSLTWVIAPGQWPSWVVIIIVIKKDRGGACPPPLPFTLMVILPLIILLTFLSTPLLAHQGAETRALTDEAESFLPQAYRVVGPQASGGLSGVVQVLGGRPVKEALVYVKNVSQGKDFY